MSSLNHIHLNEISDKKTFSFESLEALGGTSKEFQLKKLNLTLSIQDAGDGYYVTGELSFLREFPCTLCNIEAELNQNIKFDEFIRIDANFDADSEVIAKSDESESLVLKTPVWDILEFVKETINLEEPTQFYPKGQDCKSVCPNYLELLNKGILIDDNEVKPHPSFQSLKNYQIKG
jgi:uncharacterized metal-binding protein YceD (DUF177 family)